MKNEIISENIVKELLNVVLSEEVSKVKRDEFNKVQFKIEELQNSLNETIKDLRKLEDCVPGGLKTICNGRVSSIFSNLSVAQKSLQQLKDKVKQHKKSLYSQQVEEKKK